MAISLADRLGDAACFARLTEAEWLGYVEALHMASLAASEVPAILQRLLVIRSQAASATPPARDRLSSDAFWSSLLEKLWRVVAAERPVRLLTPDALAHAAQLYRDLGPDSRARHQVLRMLAASGEEAALVAFAELLVSDPPREAQDVLLAFVPLFQQKDYPPRALFPRLFDAMRDAALATVVLDLANYLVRCQRLVEHPAAGRAWELGSLLGSVVGRLAKLQEDPRPFAASADELNKMVSDSTGLVVALVNALALIGDVSVTGKLHQTLELAHRRIRIEAAWALARLGDEAGLEVLAEMAADPVVRARAVAALEELGRLDKLPDEYRLPTDAVSDRQP